MGFSIRQPRLRAAAAWGIACAATLLTGGCATTGVVDGPTALDGRDLDTAVGFYGPYSQRLDVAGKTFYVWRRAVAVDGRSMGCELRAEVAFRKQIRAIQLEGFPAACTAFSVQFTATPAMRRPEPEAVREADAGPTFRAASGCPGCRPVGGRAATSRAASSTGSGRAD